MIYIFIRDVNGKMMVRENDSLNSAYEFCLENKDSEDEILMVFINEACIYSQLMSDVPMTWEKLIGFFG